MSAPGKERRASRKGKGTTDLLPTFSRDPRPRESERETRKPQALWDRFKVLVLFLGLWAIMASTVWYDLQDLNPPVIDVFKIAANDFWWLLALACVEAVRQLHYVFEEQSKAYYRFWTKGVFGRLNRRVADVDQYVRYRMARAAKALLLLFVFSNVLGLIFDSDPTWIGLIEVPARLLGGLPFILQLSFAFMWIAVQFLAIWYFMTRGGVETYYPDDIETRFSDVWGQDQVVERLKEHLVFLENPGAIESRGGYTPGGVLLWGPPGTGKTLMAEAAAGEAGVPFVFVEAPMLGQMGGIFKVKLLYRRLRKLSMKFGGVLVFFDEADALGARAVRTGRDDWSMGGAKACNGLAYADPAVLASLPSMGVPPGEAEDRPSRFFLMGGMGGNGGLLQMLLAEMSGLKKPRGFFNRTLRRALGLRPKSPPKYRIMHIFATNLPEVLDAAMLRPGRIDRKYRVGYPSKEGRIRTYQGYLGKVAHALTDEDIEKLSVMTPYYGGADVKDLVNEAFVTAIREGRDTISWPDILKAKRHKDLGLPEDVEYVKRERHAVAVHEACHAIVAYRVDKIRAIDLATIEKGGTYLGMVKPLRREDLYTSWKTDYEAMVMTFLASLAGERLFFYGDNSSGVSNDLEVATQIATLMEGFWGMGRTIASHAITGQAGLGGPFPGPDRRRNDEQPLEGSLGSRIERNLETLLTRTAKLLDENRAGVLALAHALETMKTIDGSDVAAIIDGTAGPTVDGSRYHDPAFIEELEHYHDELARAHESKQSIEIEMPVLPVPLPAALVASGNGHEDEIREGAAPPRPDM